MKKLFHNMLVIKNLLCAQIYSACNFTGTLVEVCPGEEV